MKALRSKKAALLDHPKQNRPSEVRMACRAMCKRAGDGIRTRDINLGKVALYQLSYSRLSMTVRASPLGSLKESGTDRALRTTAFVAEVSLQQQRALLGADAINAFRFQKFLFDERKVFGAGPCTSLPPRASERCFGRGRLAAADPEPSEPCRQHHIRPDR